MAKGRPPYLTTCNPRENRADFDGDCKADRSTFDRSTGHWTSLDSSNNNYVDLPFGQSGDIRAPGDYDGDGKTDVAVFRPGTGLWAISKSSGGSTHHTRGVSGDRPVPGDYDGDSKADIAVQRPGADAPWHIVPSSTGAYYSVPFVSPDFPVPGACLTPLY